MASHPLRPAREVARGSEWGRHCRGELREKEVVLEMNTSALWLGNVAKEGCLLGGLLGCDGPSRQSGNELFHAHQPTKKHLLVAFPGMTASHCSSGHPLASPSNLSLDRNHLFRELFSDPSLILRGPLLMAPYIFSLTRYHSTAASCKALWTRNPFHSDLKSWEPLTSKKKFF